MDCPKCSVGKLNEITVRTNTLYRSPVLQGEGVNVDLTLDQCFVCNGVWFDAGELKKYLAENITIVNSPEIGQALMRGADQKIAQCPHCQVEMVKKQTPEDVSMTSDFCEKCQGVWLDSTELDRLVLKHLGHKKRFGLELENLFRMFYRKDKDDD